MAEEKNVPVLPLGLHWNGSQTVIRGLVFCFLISREREKEREDFNLPSSFMVILFTQIKTNHLIYGDKLHVWSRQFMKAQFFNQWNQKKAAQVSLTTACYWRLHWCCVSTSAMFKPMHPLRLVKQSTRIFRPKLGSWRERLTSYISRSSLSYFGKQISLCEEHSAGVWIKYLILLSSESFFFLYVI